MAVITRWSYKRGGRKAGFHCIYKRCRPLVTCKGDDKWHLLEIFLFPQTLGCIKKEVLVYNRCPVEIIREVKFD